MNIESSNFFEFNFEHCSEWSKFLFFHPTKTEEDFKNDIKLLLKLHFENYLKQEESWVDSAGLCFFIIMKFRDIGYLHVMPKSVGYYKEFTFGLDLTYSFEEETECWKNILGNDLFQKAVDHNKKIEELL